MSSNLSHRKLRLYAAHLALVMRGPPSGPWVLFKRYGDKRRVSRTIRKPINVKRAIRRWGDRIVAGVEDPRA
jgi:hypothetical protein